MARLLEAQSQPLLFYRLESDFVTGLGREHPVENGFAWHHTLGTPYLPGSSVKGVVRSWAEGWHEWAGKKEDELSAEEQAELGTYTRDLKRIFGDTDKTGAGSVIFLDALPVTSVQLKADIMTPHYTEYYEGKSPPADWLSPTPIPFLVVETGASFVFGILPRRMEVQYLEDCEQVREWLNNALCWTGAGAKTAAGYGRFEPEGNQPSKLLSLAKEFVVTSYKQGWQHDKNAFERDGEKWLMKLNANPQPDAVKLTQKLMHKYGMV